MATALCIAAHHPLSAAAALCASLAWTAAAYRFARLWVFALPACLPLLSLAPWTGWIVFEEFDLLVLGAIASGHARLALQRDEAGDPASTASRWAIAALAAVAVVPIARGLLDAGHVSFDWFQAYVDPLNSLRVGKSGLYALLIWPLAKRDFGNGRGIAHFSAGMLVGAGIVAVAAVWERIAFPGLFDFRDTYRTTAWFWEMHVGGAAIDAYVVIATPFVAWALWSSRSFGRWLGAAALTLVWAYVCLTTYARGVYLAVALQVAVVAWLLARRSPRPGLLVGWAAGFVAFATTLYVLDPQTGHARAALALFAVAGLVGWMQRDELRRGNWRLMANLCLAFVLVLEVAAVAGSGSFMAARVMGSAGDYQSRSAHWLRGIGLLHTPAQWLFGIGAGRLPGAYARAHPQFGFPGFVQVAAGSTGLGIRLGGSDPTAILGGHLGLTQRVLPQPDYRVEFDLLASAPASVLLQVCDAHLLYATACRRALVQAAPNARRRWSRISVPLGGPALKCSSVLAPATCTFVVAVVNPGGEVVLDNLVLKSSQRDQLLANGDFALGRARWFPLATGNFVPWHIDNLYLELLIERGLAGLGVLALVTVAVLRRQPMARSSAAQAWPFVVSALAGVLCLGLVSSLIDMPRVALLACLLLAAAARLCERGGQPSI